jgi:hypothetical protein
MAFRQKNKQMHTLSGEVIYFCQLSVFHMHNFLLAVIVCRISDLDSMLLQSLMDFVYQLLCSGDLTMAKALRVKIIEKCNTKQLNSASSMLLPSLNIYTR